MAKQRRTEAREGSLYSEFKELMITEQYKAAYDFFMNHPGMPIQVTSDLQELLGHVPVEKGWDLIEEVEKRASQARREHTKESRFN